jgi:hypothetical protein
VLESVEDGQALVSGEGLSADAQVIVAGGSKVTEGQPIQTQQRN